MWRGEGGREREGQTDSLAERALGGAVSILVQTDNFFFTTGFFKEIINLHITDIFYGLIIQWSDWTPATKPSLHLQKYNHQ